MKRFLLLLTIFIICTALIQILITKFIAPFLPFTLGVPGISNLDKYLYSHHKILYFGDSTIKYSSPKDINKSSISEILTNLESSYSIGDVSSPAYQLKVFEAMLNYISNSSDKPGAIIVPINLRSFSPSWDMAPDNQFENEIFFLNHHFLSYFSKPLNILRAIKTEIITDEAFITTPVYYKQKKIGTVKDFIDKEDSSLLREDILKNKYIFYYMYNLDENHRLIKSLKKMIETADKLDIKLYPYITPIDFEDGTKYVGLDFIDQTKINTEKICTILKINNLPCLNLTFDLNSDYFDFDESPNEHLNERGREYVANKLKEFIIK